MGISKNLVIVHNPQWAYFNSKGSSYLGEKAQELKVSIKEWIESLDKEGTLVFYTRDVRSIDDDFYSSNNTMCEVGSDDVRLQESLRGLENTIINTARPDATFRTPLLAMVSKYKIHKVFLVGVETHLSVLMTAHSLRNLGFDVSVVEPLTLSSDEYLHNAAIAIMADGLGVEIIGS